IVQNTFSPPKLRRHIVRNLAESLYFHGTSIQAGAPPPARFVIQRRNSIPRASAPLPAPSGEAPENQELSFFDPREEKENPSIEKTPRAIGKTLYMYSPPSPFP